MREAFVQVAPEPARQQAAQLPDDVRHPVGHDLGGRAVGDRRGLPARQPAGARASSARTSASSGAAARRMQAGGERAGRQILLTVDDARAIARRVVA